MELCGVAMDDELYDEFGNYIGPGLADSSEVRAIL